MPVQTISLFDTVTDSADAPVANATVTLTFGYNSATTADGLLQPSQRTVQTDGTGKFTFAKVIPVDLISPANTVFVIETPFRVYEVAPLSTNGASQQSTAANVIVNNPLALAPYTLIGPVSVTGTLAVTGALTVVSNTGMQVDALGNISGRSLSLSSTGPYGAFLPGGASPNTVPTPAGMSVGALVDFGGELWNLKAFGAKLDGVTDDTGSWTTASTGAIAKAAGNKAAITWVGTCVITANLNFATAPAYIRGIGPGSVLKVSGTGFSAITLPASASGSWLADFVIDGGASARDGTGVSHGINGGSTTDITMRNVEIKNTGHSAVNTGGAPARWILTECRIHDNFDEGALFGSGGNNNTLKGCLMYNNAYNAIDLNTGQVTVDNCQLYSNGTKAGVSYASQVDRGGMVVFAPNAVTIQNGTIQNTLFFSNTYHGLFLHTATGGTISDYTITNCQSFSNGSAGATNVADGFLFDANSSGGTITRVSIAGCLARQNSRSGIGSDGCSYINITGNISDANGGYTGGGTAPGVGIYIHLTVSPAVIGNTVTNHTTQNAIGINTQDAGTTDAIIANNSGLGTNTTPISDGGTRTILSGNKRGSQSNWQVMGEMSAVPNGGNPAQMTVYGVGSSQQDTNWEAARLYYAGPNWLLGNIAGGTGIARPLQIAGFSSLKLSPGVVLDAPGAFVTGDKYLIIDSSGNVHKSGIGPAS